MAPGLSRLAVVALVGLFAVTPSVVAEVAFASPAMSRIGIRWAPLAVPASLAAAFLAVLVARRWFRDVPRHSTLALAGGGTLGFFLGRMLFHSLWSHGFAGPGITFTKAAAVLQVATAAALGAFVLSAAANRFARKAT
jgi:hypothetical protein